MNSIIYDDEIITPEDNTWNYYYNFIKKLNHRDCVKFTLFCAKIVNPNIKESNTCIDLVEKWLKDRKSVTPRKLYAAYYNAVYTTSNAAWTAYYAANAANAANADYIADAAWYAANAVNDANAAAITNDAAANINIINKYLQILLRETKQFQNNKILEQISKPDIDKLELVDWNMITDIIQEEYNIIHEFSYEDIFSRRCLIELLRKEYA